MGVHNPSSGHHKPSWSHLVNPRPQVGGALVQARVLDEVALAPRGHHPAVVPVEVVQVGLVPVGLHAGVGRAAGVVLPGSTLQMSRGQTGQGARSWGQSSSIGQKSL